MMSNTMKALSLVACVALMAVFGGCFSDEAASKDEPNGMATTPWNGTFEVVEIRCEKSEVWIIDENGDDRLIRFGDQCVVGCDQSVTQVKFLDGQCTWDPYKGTV